MSAPTKPRPVVTSATPCPCGSGKPFGQCCEPIIRQQRVAANAEEVMRSRFTAHVLGDYAHLHRTDLETAKQPYEPVQEEEGAVTWTRLEIHAHEPGPKPELAFVDFTAYFKDGDAERALDEKSEFQKVDGVWYYTRAVRTGPRPIKAPPKVGRNDPCPCGSGKKYKHCCGR
jgi:SEC-C motif-containing protein